MYHGTGLACRCLHIEQWHLQWIHNTRCTESSMTMTTINKSFRYQSLRLALDCCLSLQHLCHNLLLLNKEGPYYPAINTTYYIQNLNMWCNIRYTKCDTKTGCVISEMHPKILLVKTTKMYACYFTIDVYKLLAQQPLVISGKWYKPYGIQPSLHSSSLRIMGFASLQRQTYWPI